MVWLIIGLIFTTIIVWVMKSTHCKLYDGRKLQWERDITVPLWQGVLIYIVMIIPIIGIIAFIAFLIWYVVHSMWGSDCCSERWIFSFKEDIGLHKIWSKIGVFLNKKL